MGLFNKLFGKNKVEVKQKKGFYAIQIQAIEKLTAESVKVVFDIPENLKGKFNFLPGQYINISVEVNGEEVRRSYSICSGVNEPVAIGIKQVEGGKASSWFNQSARVGDQIWVSAPLGNFIMDNAGGRYVAFAAGSGITPILSIAKAINVSKEGSLKLFFGNRKLETIMFKNELSELEKGNHLEMFHYLSEENVAPHFNGILSKENVSNLIREDLSLLKADGFYICGPEDMILTISETLKMFGVKEDKIHFELFTTPVKMKKETVEVTSDFKGLSKVTVIIDEEEHHLTLETDTHSVLDEAEANGVDAPYSCRGGVCCTCKGKILKGTAKMTTNLSLTDNEVKEGYVLTCQARPTSEELVISYDE